MTRRRLKKVRGVGINDADYVVTSKKIDSEGNIYFDKCPYYMRWKGVIDRCYSEKIHEKVPSYKDCYVCDEWLTFSNFKLWMENQDWKGKELDKDILFIGNKIYSPETCIFIDKHVNVMIAPKKKSDNGFMIGVSNYHPHKNLYSASITDHRGKLRCIGVYEGQYQAHLAWQKAKINQYNIVIGEQSDKRVIDGLTVHRDLLQKDIDNGVETNT